MQVRDAGGVLGTCEYCAREGIALALPLGCYMEYIKGCEVFGSRWSAGRAGVMVQ